MGWLKNVAYDILKISNDQKAIKKNKVGKRIARRIIGKSFGKGLRKLIK